MTRIEPTSMPPDRPAPATRREPRAGADPAEAAAAPGAEPAGAYRPRPDPTATSGRLVDLRA